MRFAVRALAIAVSAAIVLLLYVGVIHPWFVTMGATAEEIAALDRTDKLLESPAKLQATRAITIQAPQLTAWAWLVQVGQGKGGWYSYDILENVLAQCDVHSADRIISEFQSPRTGDEFHFCRNGPTTHLYVEPGRTIAYAPGYAFILSPINATTTRLVVRSRLPYPAELGRLGDFVAWDVVLDTAHFVMEEKMLDGIRRRAEHSRVDTPLADDVQVLLWTIGFLVMVAGTIGIFFGPVFWPQLIAAWAGLTLWMVLMLLQPSIAFGIPLAVLLIAAVALLADVGFRRKRRLSVSNPIPR